MDKSLQITGDTLAFNTTLIRLGLEGLSEADGRRRLEGGFNSPIFLASHVIAGRHNMARLAGLHLPDNWQELFGTDVACTDGEGYPDLATVKQSLSEVTEPLLARLENLNEADLLSPAKAGPARDQTVRGGLGFWTWHETYHVGQLGMVRARMGHGTIRERFYQEQQAAAAR